MEGNMRQAVRVHTYCTPTTPRAVERTDPPYLTRSVPYFELKSTQFSVSRVSRLVRSRILLEKLPVP